MNFFSWYTTQVKDKYKNIFKIQLTIELNFLNDYL